MELEKVGVHAIAIEAMLPENDKEEEEAKRLSMEHLQQHCGGILVQLEQLEPEEVRSAVEGGSCQRVEQLPFVSKYAGRAYNLLEHKDEPTPAIRSPKQPHEVPFGPQHHRYDVFISKRMHETDDFTRVLYHVLEQLGLRTFLDVYSIEGGKLLTEPIAHALKEVKVVMACLSPGVGESKWCKMEMRHALARRETQVLPVFYGHGVNPGGFPGVFSGKRGELVADKWNEAQLRVLVASVVEAATGKNQPDAAVPEAVAYGYQRLLGEKERRKLRDTPEYHSLPYYVEPRCVDFVPRDANAYVASLEEEEEDRGGGQEGRGATTPCSG